MSVRPAKTQIILGIRPVCLIRVFAVRLKKPWALSYPLSAKRRLWSDWADAHADLSLRWAHTHFVGFVMSRLICNFPIRYITKNLLSIRQYIFPYQNIQKSVETKPACVLEIVFFFFFFFSFLCGWWGGEQQKKFTHTHKKNPQYFWNFQKLYFMS